MGAAIVLNKYDIAITNSYLQELPDFNSIFG